MYLTLSSTVATAALLLSPGSSTPASIPAPVQDEILGGGRTAIQLPERASDTALSRSMLPTDTGFVIHVDIQGLLGSIWWSAVDDATNLMDEIADDEEFAEVQREFGINPFKDFLAVTVVGHDEDGDDAVVILHTTDKIDTAIAKARGMDEYRTTAHDGLELETWSDGDDDDSVHALVVGRPDGGTRRIVIGQDPDRVVKSARTLLGEERSLADVDRPSVLAQPKKGSYVYLEVGLSLDDLLEGTPASQLASKTERFTVDLGEGNDSVYLAATVATSSQDDARDVADVINGAKSMLTLSGVLEEIPGVFADVFDDARAEINGSLVSLALSISTDDLKEGLEEIQDEN